VNAVQIGSYNSKAEPVAQALQAMNTMNQKGWKTIRRYYPELGADNGKPPQTVNPRNLDDRRFFANFATEDPGRSSTPLVAMICSLDARDTSGDLQALRGELLEATAVPDYSTWSLDRLRQAIHDLTREQTTDKGVKYRAPKTTVTFKESVHLYAMTVTFLAKDTKWVSWRENIEKLGYSLPPAPEIVDFSNRLRQQLPMTIPPGATRGMLLYRPGWDIAQPRSKEEFEERADVVLIKRAGATFHANNFRSI
jgi:hypothetical protein